MFNATFDQMNNVAHEYYFGFKAPLKAITCVFNLHALKGGMWEASRQTSLNKSGKFIRYTKTQQNPNANLKHIKFM